MQSNLRCKAAELPYIDTIQGPEALVLTLYNTCGPRAHRYKREYLIFKYSRGKAAELPYVDTLVGPEALLITIGKARRALP